MALALGDFFLNGIKRLTDMVFRMGSRKEEAETVGAFLNSGEGNGHYVNAALEQGVGQKARHHGVAHHDRHHRIALTAPVSSPMLAA